MKKFGLSVRAIHSVTIEEAWSQNANIWNIERVDVIVSPEILSNTFFQRLLDVERKEISYPVLYPHS